MRTGRRSGQAKVSKERHQEPSSEEAQQSLPQIATTAATLVGAVAALATIIGFCLHLAGDIANSTYLTSLGVEPSSFPQAVDSKIIHGYYVTLLQGLGLLKDVPWGAVLSIIGLSTLAIVIIRIPVKEDFELRNWLDRRSFWVKQPIVAALASTLFLSATVCVGCLVLLMAIVPGLAGEKFGKSKADEMNAFLKRETAHFSELWRDDELLVSGHVITTNENLIAIYDINTKAMRTLPREGIEIRTPLPALSIQTTAK